jgi:hypothetical protein
MIGARLGARGRPLGDVLGDGGVMQDDLHSDSTRQNGVIAGNTNSMTQYSVAKMN